MILQFLDYEIDINRRRLTRAETLVHVEPQVFDLLVYLVQNRDRVVSKDDLFATVWEGRIVSDSTLTSRINAVRKAVGDSGKEQKLIGTIARKGFRFLGEVRAPAAPDPTSAGGRPPTETSEHSRSTRPLTERPAIAVLPFTNMSGEAEQDYFSDGISEELLTVLQKIPGLHVAARTSAFSFKGRSATAQEIGEILPDGVGGALIPMCVRRRLLRRENLHEAAREMVELVCAVDVPVERDAVELREHVDAAQARVQAV